MCRVKLHTLFFNIAYIIPVFVVQKLNDDKEKGSVGLLKIKKVNVLDGGGCRRSGDSGNNIEG